MRPAFRALVALAVLLVELLVGAGWSSPEAVFWGLQFLGLAGVAVSLTLLGGVWLTMGVVWVLSLGDKR